MISIGKVSKIINDDVDNNNVNNIDNNEDSTILDEESNFTDNASLIKERTHQSVETNCELNEFIERNINPISVKIRNSMMRSQINDSTSLKETNNNDSISCYDTAKDDETILDESTANTEKANSETQEIMTNELSAFEQNIFSTIDNNNFSEDDFGLGLLELPPFDEESCVSSMKSGQQAARNQCRSDLKPSDGPRIENFGDVMKAFALPPSTTKHIPSFKMRKNSTCLNEEIPLAKWHGLLNAGCKSVLSLLRAICPGPSLPLLQYAVIQKVARANLNPNTQFNTHKLHKDLMKSEAKFERLINSITRVLRSSSRGSINRQVLRSILVDGIASRMELRSILLSNQLPGISGSCRVIAKKDMEQMLNGISLEKWKYSRKKCSDASCHFAVEFILDSSNVHTLSWGSIDYHISATELVVLPKLCRKMSRHSIITRYFQKINESTNNIDRLSKSSFYKILQHITHSDEQILTSIDYVSTLLVTEPIEALQDIIEKLIPQHDQKHLTDQLQRLTMLR